MSRKSRRCWSRACDKPSRRARWFMIRSLTGLYRYRDQVSVPLVSVSTARIRGILAAPKDEPPKALTGSSGTSAVVLLQLEKLLCLNNARRDEEDELLVGSAHRAALE